MFTRALQRTHFIGLVVSLALAGLGALPSLALPPVLDSQLVDSRADLATATISTAQDVASRAAAAAAAAPAVPAYDHVMVVIMENHSADNIMANPAAPYINALAADGASMTQSFAVTHPSQPNYIALFSGSQQGVVDDSCLGTFPADNLGAQLIAAGKTFVGYSEDMPSAGFTGCQSTTYARKHNPWVDFSNVPASSNQPLTSLPADWANLPTVSMVVPNLLNDMHDGTIAQADTWLHDRVDGYLQWAELHNSLLVLTWDEDDRLAGNRIPTIIAGAGVRPGLYPERITHYNVLRTLQDMYGLPPLAGSATAGAIVDIWQSAPADQPPIASFTGSCTLSVCSVDGAGSTDPDGSIASYTWDWSDGSTGSGAAASHTFGTPGAKTVTLMVTDDLGRTNTTSNVLTAAGPASGQPFAVDSFARTRLTGWGPADLGGTWTVTSSAASSVGAGAGRLAVAIGQTNSAMLPSVSSSDSDLQTTFSVDQLPTGSGVYLGIVGRHTGTNLEYFARVMIRSDGQVGLLLTSLNGSSSVVTLKPQIIVPGVSTAASAAVKVRLQVTGTSPTTIRAKVWQATAAEPAAWQQTATDSFAALQSAGSVGVSPYLSSSSTVSPVTLRFSGFSVRPSNQPPSASFTGSCASLTCTMNGTGSADPDGTIASYAWNWGDGTTTTGPTSTHAYVGPGTYQVTLIVTDDRGALTSVSHVFGPTLPANAPPTAAFTASCVLLTCHVDSAPSADPDGVLAGFTWSWGDGAVATGATSDHSYTVAGSFPIGLIVTDNAGATGTASRTVVVTAPATAPPVAGFVLTCTLRSCDSDAGASSDSDGTIARYDWTWGDGSTSTGPISHHDYISAGSFSVQLTVTDNLGATGTATRTAVATAPPNQPPTAMAAGSCPSLTCSVSATGSMDPEGSALTYSWNWADGSPAGSGLTASHVYASAGARTAVLTVTDQQGGVGTTQLVLTPSGSTAPFASDTFARTLASGWGAANTGGVWTTGSAIRYSVKAGAGSVITKAGETNSAVLQAVSSSDTDFKGTFGTDKLASGNGSYITLIGRRVGTNREYQARLRARADGSVAIQLGLLNGSATVTVLRPEVVPSGVTVAGGGTVTARFQVTGTQPTALRLKVWPTGAAEPTAWQLTTTDSVAALQVPGSVGVQMYVSGSSTVTPVTLKVSNFSAQPAAGN